jgi:20S proteasome subunit alpha 1
VKTSGLTSIGLRGKDSCVLITEKRVGDKLIDSKTVTNLFNITQRIGALTTGILGFLLI